MEEDSNQQTQNQTPKTINLQSKVRNNSSSANPNFSIKREKQITKVERAMEIQTLKNSLLKSKMMKVHILEIQACQQRTGYQMSAFRTLVFGTFFSLKSFLRAMALIFELPKGLKEWEATFSGQVSQISLGEESDSSPKKSHGHFGRLTDHKLEETSLTEFLSLSGNSFDWIHDRLDDIRFSVDLLETKKTKVTRVSQLVSVHEASGKLKLRSSLEPKGEQHSPRKKSLPSESSPLGDLFKDDTKIEQSQFLNAPELELMNSELETLFLFLNLVLEFEPETVAPVKKRKITPSRSRKPKEDANKENLLTPGEEKVRPDSKTRRRSPRRQFFHEEAKGLKKLPSDEMPKLEADEEAFFDEIPVSAKKKSVKRKATESATRKQTRKKRKC